MENSTSIQKAFGTVLQNCTLMQLAGAPSGSYLDKDGLPHMDVNGTDLCMVRCSSYGEVFHSAHSRCAGARYPSHVLDLTPCAPCRVCKPSVPNLHWYNQLLSIVLVLAQYHVPLPHIALTPDDHMTADMIPPILPDDELYEEAAPLEFNLALPILQQAIAQQMENEPTDSNLS